MKSFIILIMTLITVITTVKAGDTLYKKIEEIRKGDSITAIAETTKFIWVGTQHKGLYLIKKKNHKSYHLTPENSSLLSTHITAIAVGKEDEVYVGTNKGMLHYDNFAFLPLTSENSNLKSNYITCLIMTSTGSLWVGTLNGGLTVFSGLRSKTFHSDNSSLSSNHILGFEKNGEQELIAILSDQARLPLNKNSLADNGIAGR